MAGSLSWENCTNNIRDFLENAPPLVRLYNFFHHARHEDSITIWCPICRHNYKKLDIRKIRTIDHECCICLEDKSCFSLPCSTQENKHAVCEICAKQIDKSVIKKRELNGGKPVPSLIHQLALRHLVYLPASKRSFTIHNESESIWIITYVRQKINFYQFSKSQPNEFESKMERLKERYEFFVGEQRLVPSLLVPKNIRSFIDYYNRELILLRNGNSGPLHSYVSWLNFEGPKLLDAEVLDRYYQHYQYYQTHGLLAFHAGPSSRRIHCQREEAISTQTERRPHTTGSVCVIP
jgi:hypothetical protein